VSLSGLFQDWFECRGGRLRKNRTNMIGDPLLDLLDHFGLV